MDALLAADVVVEQAHQPKEAKIISTLFITLDGVVDPGKEAARALRDAPSVKGVIIPGSISVVRQFLAAGLIGVLGLIYVPAEAPGAAA